MTEERRVPTITFDSNVWRVIVSPDAFPKDSEIQAAKRVNSAIQLGRAEGRLSETVFTLEGVQRADRKEYLARYKPEQRVSISDSRGRGKIDVQFTIAASTIGHPGNSPYLSKHLQDALALRFRLMKCPRFGSPKNPDINDAWYVAQPEAAVVERLKRIGETLQALEARGSGIAKIESIGKKYATQRQTWFDGLGNAPVSLAGEVASAVAEWADADSIAAHVGYGNDYFCTRDEGRAGGAASALAPASRAWLTSTYALRFVSISELASLV